MRESFPLDTLRVLRSTSEAAAPPRRAHTETGRISELVRVEGEETAILKSPRASRSSCLKGASTLDDEDEEAEILSQYSEGNGSVRKKIKVSPQAGRWAMLFYLSALAMLSDWICFSAAPIARYVQEVLLLHDSHLVTCFLATNVISCLLEPAFVRRFGLRAAVVWGAIVMALGCGLRSAAVKLALTERAWGFQFTQIRAPAVLALLGTMLVAGAQPLFQCTPSLLAANWFGENETTLAVTVALNANQLGIAAAYAIGAALVHSEDALLLYFRSLFVVTALLALGTRVHFRERPRHPPSYSALESRRREAKQSLRRKAIDSFRRDSNSYGALASPRASHGSSPRGTAKSSPRVSYEESPRETSKKKSARSSNGIPRELSSLRPPKLQNSRSDSWAQAEAAAEELVAAGVLSPPPPPPPPPPIIDDEAFTSPLRRSKLALTRDEPIYYEVNRDNGEDDIGGVRCSGIVKRRGKIQPVKLVRRWIVVTHKVGHGALDITRNLYADTRGLCRLSGFAECLIAFVASIVASNIFSTFLPHLIARARLRTGECNSTTNARIACLGALFQLMIMAGSLTVGAIVDLTKAYKTAMLTCFFGTIITILMIADDHTVNHRLDFAVLMLGFFVGPIQPIAAELAVEQTYPNGDENAIVATQQTCGNFFSALAVPAFKTVSDLTRKYQQSIPIRFDYASLAAFVATAATAFRYGPGYHAPLARVAANANSENEDYDANDDASSNMEEARSAKYNSL